MSWDRSRVAPAIVDCLTAAVPGVSAFDRPPATFNAPAYVVGLPTVTYDTPTFGIDLAVLPVAAAAGVEEADRIDDLLRQARAALLDTGNLGGVVQLLIITEQRNWQRLNVGGADLLTAELAVTIRM